MNTINKLEFLRSNSLPSLVQEEVLRMIKAGELAAGARLNELDLAERLKISRSPLREAMRALEEAGLVRLERNRGMFVRQVSLAEALELYQVRAALDDQAGRLLAPVITSAQLSELGVMLDGLEALGESDIDHTFPRNIAFHDRLVEMTGNTTLLGLYRQVINRMHLLRRRSFAGGNAASHREHREILAALATRSPQAAANAMRAHVEHGYERMHQASAQDAPQNTMTRARRRKDAA
ncbi:MAG: GntR family transcriptional regulator [Acidocella sp.]|nr:GntR family transcriptional regulator [Acidocella sp.]